MKRVRCEDAAAAPWEAVRRAAASLIQASSSQFVPLPGAALAADRADVQPWEFTEAHELVLPARSVMLANVLTNLAGPAARHSGLEARTSARVPLSLFFS
jgi:hypothetical protein